MHILMLVLNQTGRGTYWRAYQLGRQMVKRGHQVSLMAMSPSERWHLLTREEDGLAIVETPDLLPGPLRSGWDPWDTLRRLQWVRGRSFDLVHAFETRPVVIYPALLAQSQGARLVLDWCDWFGKGGSVEERPNRWVRSILRPVETYFENNFRCRADGTTVINSVLRERAIQLGVPADTILLLRNGSDIGFDPVDAHIARQAVGLPQGVPLIGFVGGTYTRDAEFMAQAFNRVLERSPDAKLLLVGNFNRSIEPLLADPRAALRTGSQPMDQIYQYLSACDLGWLPLMDSGANRGRWPLKLNDYMTTSRAVVATDVGDLGEVIVQENLGVVSPPDPLIFAERTLALLEDDQQRKSLGRSARHAAETRFNWNTLADDLESFYQQVMDHDG